MPALVLALATVVLLAGCRSSMSTTPGSAAPASSTSAASTLDAWPDAAGDIQSAALAELAIELWGFLLQSDPIWAGRLGDPRWLGSLRDESPAGFETRRRQLREWIGRAAVLADGALSASDEVSLHLLREQLDLQLTLHELGFEEWSVDPRDGPQVGFLSLVEDQPTDTAAQRTALVARWTAMAPAVDTHIANLRRGLQRGRVANRASIVTVIEQLDRLLAEPTAEWTLSRPTLPADLPAAERERLLDSVRHTLEQGLRPAFERYRTCLHDELLPAARGDEQPGLASLPDGTAQYERLIQVHTGQPLTAAELHALGLDEVARIRAEIAALGQAVLGTGDLAEIQRRLRDDPALHFTTRDEVQATAEAALRRAEAAVPRAFGLLPHAPCEVVRVPEHEERDTTIAYYREPAADGSRPGRYYVNTYAPETRPRYEAEVLAFHESVPGHHLQIAIAQERTGLPRFRRETGSTAYVEGWALYTERLADELGLYGSGVDRLGILSFDAWRACRLVVDTGLHADGWSRSRAIDYLRENTLLADNNVENEVDRYITTPGQALAYKVGQLEIARLRKQAEATLGTSFELRAFHDVILREGAVTLPVLRAQVEQWIAAGRAPASPR